MTTDSTYASLHYVYYSPKLGDYFINDKQIKHLNPMWVDQHRLGCESWIARMKKQRTIAFKAAGESVLTTDTTSGYDGINESKTTTNEDKAMMVINKDTNAVEVREVANVPATEKVKTQSEVSNMATLEQQIKGMSLEELAALQLAIANEMHSRLVSQQDVTTNQVDTPASEVEVASTTQQQEAVRSDAGVAPTTKKRVAVKRNVKKPATVSNANKVSTIAELPTDNVNAVVLSSITDKEAAKAYIKQQGWSAINCRLSYDKLKTAIGFALELGIDAVPADYLTAKAQARTKTTTAKKKVGFAKKN